MVVVSCVTKDAPDNKGYRPHPHNLVGKEVCKKGVCTVEVPAGNMVVTFSNLGIQCVKKKDIEEALRMRQELRVDPFRSMYMTLIWYYMYNLDERLKIMENFNYCSWF